jgi:hypothetical protein
LTTTELIPQDDNSSVDTSVLSYSELLGLESYRIAGTALVDKKELLGVPHIITKVTFWMPKQLKDGSYQSGMASVEATLGDEATLTMAAGRGWIPGVESFAALKLNANERIVYNDGSTGVRRQLVAIFHTAGLITVAARDKKTEEEFASNRVFDRPWTDWAAFTQHVRQSDEVGAVPCISRDDRGNPLVIRVDRGLSVSAYSNDYTDEGETYYLR